MRLCQRHLFDAIYPESSHLLNNLNADSLKVFARKLNLPKTLARRDELMAALDKELRLNLSGVLARLSETENKELARIS
jgi:hypothetical protein